MRIRTEACSLYSSSPTELIVFVKLLCQIMYVARWRSECKWFMAVMKFLLILVVSLNFWEKFERETIGNCLASETLSETCRNYRKMMEFGRNSKSADELELEDGGGVWHTTRRKRR